MKVEFKNRQLDLARVNVVGVSGSGKSTIANKLATTLGSPLIEMDRLFWHANWVESEIPEFQQKVRSAIHQSDHWVLDGNYHSKTYEIKWPPATTVIWLDYSFRRCLRQATTRAIKRAWTKKELWPNTGNRESFRKLFGRDSIVLWTITSFHQLRLRYERCQQDPRWAHLEFVRLKKPSDAIELLNSCRCVGDKTRDGLSTQ